MDLAGCAIIENNAILLLHRMSKDWYELPGGKVNPNESAENAAVRELKEELNIDVKLLKKLGEKEFADNMRYTWFLASITSGNLKIGETKTHDHFKFIPLSDLNRYNLSPNMKNCAEMLPNL
ncbi:MAG TPA: NUDIX hydrolase [Candidatus Nanoarchaeia archaeon]|nr:NUDIX hydrolase [Candidatus Nanoarchaeia archaeon]